MQSCSNGHGTLGFTGARGTTHQEITHLHRSSGSDLCVTANIHHLIRDDVPFRQFRHQLFLQEGKLSSGRQLVLAFKIGMGDLGSCCSHSHAAGLGKDREFTCNDGVRRISAGIQLRLGHPKHIAGFLDFCLDMRRTALILDSPICVIAHDCHSFCGLVEV